MYIIDISHFFSFLIYCKLIAFHLVVSNWVMTYKIVMHLSQKLNSSLKIWLFSWVMHDKNCIRFHKKRMVHILEGWLIFILRVIVWLFFFLCNSWGFCWYTAIDQICDGWVQCMHICIRSNRIWKNIYHGNSLQVNVLKFQ